MCESEPHSREWRRLCLVLVGLILARGVVWLCVLPPFEGWDEYQHVGYVAHVAKTGERPVPMDSTVPEDLLEALLRYPHPDPVVESQLGRLGAVGYARYWSRHDSREAVPAPGGRVGDNPVPLYQAQHAPFYYRLAAPLFDGLGGVARLVDVVAALRALNIALTAGALALSLHVFRRVTPSRLTAGFTGLILATHPLFLMNGARVASDALGVFLAVSAVAFGFRLMTWEARDRYAIPAGALGLLVGLAALAKATNLALLPFAILAWFIGTRKQYLTGRAIVAGYAILSIGFLLVMQEELRFNLGRFGTPTAMQEAVMNRRADRGLVDLVVAATRLDPLTATRRLWVRELFFAGGWTMIRPFPGAIKAYQFAATVGLLGWFALAARGLTARLRGNAGRVPAVFHSEFRGAWTGCSLVILVASYSAALIYHSAHSWLAWGAVATNPWYACPALPWFLAIVVTGGHGWPAVGRLVPLVMAGAGLAIEFVSVFGSMTLVYSGGATGLEALGRLASLQPGILGTPTLATAWLASLALTAAATLSLRDLARTERTGGACLASNSG